MSNINENVRAAKPPGGGLLALAQVASHHGIKTTPAELRHRIAVNGEAVTSEDLVVVARKIGLKARLVRKPSLQRLRNLPVPAMVQMKSGTWAIFGIETALGKYRLYHPMSQKEEQVSLPDLLQRMAGDVVLVTKPSQIASESFKFGLAWFMIPVRRYWQPISHVLVASFFIQLIGLGLPLTFQLVIDKVLVYKSYSTLLLVITALLLLSIFEAALKYMRTYVLNHTSNRIDVELGARLFEHLLSLPISFFETRAAGVIVTRAREIENVRRFLTGKSLPSVIDLTFVLLYIAVLFLYSQSLTFIVLATWPLYIFIGAVIRPAFRRKTKDKFRKWANSQQLLVESIVGVQTLKASAVEPMFQRKWEERLSSYIRTSFETSLLGAIAQGSTEFVTKLSTALILYFGVQQAISGSMTIGALIAYVMIANRVTQPILRVAQLWQDFQEVQVSIEHLGDIFNAPSEQLEPGLTELPPLRGAIELRNVRFRYRPELPDALKSISLRIAAGEVVGVVGPSGSGKSTLTKLLQRLYEPTQGQILLDGVDLSQIDTAWLRRQLGVVLQENFLFNQSVHENIALAKPSMTRGEVVHVARLAGADEFINKLPQGYDTKIEERGANLSGGQRQRIAIARALATNPRILIFDEATSALDYESERAIRANMQEIARDRTVIIIAHRLAAVKDCDRIIGVLDGEVQEVGTHSGLLTKQGGLYARLWAIQSEQANG
ncbi:type I secretion system permease/ATPase [Methylovirgula sp. 4M-Z18]|uniref:type I secretion system permease/ATPase n=1 Tax=Methylovirgula sp. 4M-Z18 TaxID=2293567 RepID=UPI000E2E5C44|nr:type I secretion system permease/ATPase [Methylovirgula sp. 4M-Z18]RFB77943.1 type I secretion system permease/ATPase [Methylovirgula sp. 4M-Z18]